MWQLQRHIRGNFGHSQLQKEIKKRKKERNDKWKGGRKKDGKDGGKGGREGGRKEGDRAHIKPTEVESFKNHSL